jgi:hypothetical protein
VSTTVDLLADTVQDRSGAVTHAACPHTAFHVRRMVTRQGNTFDGCVRDLATFVETVGSGRIAMSHDIRLRVLARTVGRGE